jgi:hypothetical protein
VADSLSSTVVAARAAGRAFTTAAAERTLRPVSQDRVPAVGRGSLFGRSEVRRGRGFGSLFLARRTSAVETVRKGPTWFACSNFKRPAGGDGSQCASGEFATGPSRRFVSTVSPTCP